MFVRVVERPEPEPEGASVWWLETPDAAAPPLPFRNRAEAMAVARARAPEWLEVGEVVPASGSAPRHHRWTTFRRDAGGEYRPSALGWAGRPPRDG